MYGGAGLSTIGQDSFDDLWKFDLSLNQWIWIKGDHIGIPVYGVKGVAAIGNNPGTKFGASSWTDNAGNLWLFGGVSGGFSNDLWKFNISSNMWTWISGDNTLNQLGVYGIKGVASPTNKPGSRSGASSWIDIAKGNLWFFGGYMNLPTSTSMNLNDLWKYNIAADKWTWVSGDNIPNQSGVYGTIGIGTELTKPSTKTDAAAWRDPNTGALYLFGGRHHNDYFLNDLWKYSDLNTGQCCQSIANLTENKTLGLSKQLNKFVENLTKPEKTVLSDEKNIKYKQLEGIPITHIQLYNTNGQLVKVVNKKEDIDNILLNSKSQVVNVGLYFLRITYKDKSVITLKKVF